ncbi:MULTISPECIES: hypothetical protein [Ruminococcus]|uniref:Virus attachment protein p12 family protein n=1 Tax=Ruminococcus albus (strain ATCC 27210 / DSM 20455 / JCM 14654 / NCDO 2250 / 7) TaxID=697329 RepID=E6UC11_RUMA7|nr:MULTISPECIES: hypothetical protein [Ruminococcus]ADU21562.1 hypothetical protein Rumal_1036 [Ruminococcus albus 7 = DSM 20455]MCR5020008.1 hypothetical protein [Ruminococcus sp.]
MNIADIVLVVLIAAALAGAVYHCIRSRGKCSCSCCCGDCSQCRGKI